MGEKDDNWRVSLVFFVQGKSTARELMDGLIVFAKQSYKIADQDIKLGMRSANSRW